MKTYYSGKKHSIVTWLAAGLFLMTSMAFKAQCNANFTYTMGLNGAVYFSSTSTGTSSSTYYVWNFGSGLGYGSASSHTFNTNGNHWVCLTITDSTSSPTCTSQYCDTVLVTNAPTNTCTANYTYSIGTNGSVYFTSTSTGTSSSTHYTWNFGGGPSDTATGSPLWHTFSTNGYKTVCLTINDTWSNCSNTHCDSVHVTNSGTTTPCNANYTYTLGANGAVYFTSTSTGTTTSTNYSWNFGGSSTGIGTAPTHTYTSNGAKWVCLTITGPGCNSTKCDTIVISNVSGTNTPCTANFTYTLGTNGSVNFASTSTGTSSTTHYAWNFYGSGSGTGLTTSNTFTANGMYVCCLTISDSTSGCYDIGCDSVNITNVSTTCSPSVVYYLVKDSTQNLTWDAYASYPSNITGATWYWGDGSTSTGLYPSHTYSAAGTYSTCVTVSVSCGTITATYCYVAAIFRGGQNNDMIVLNVRQAVPTGIKAVIKKDGLLNIYPNPNSGSFTIEQNESNNYGESRLSIYNMLGEKVFEKNIVSVGKQNIDVNEFPNGTYFVKMVSDTGCYMKKISVQK